MSNMKCRVELRLGRSGDARSGSQAHGGGHVGRMRSMVDIIYIYSARGLVMRAIEGFRNSPVILISGNDLATLV